MSTEEVESTGTRAATATDDTDAMETTEAKRYAVHPDYRVNVRSGPGTNHQLVRVLSYGATVPVNCQKTGEWIAGPYGTTNLWDNIANGQYISDAYVYTGSSGYIAPHCA
ncbi:peptidase [Streptomyces sp. NPDC087850]|uniref:peptidase n=1 Tax=Streptomyces sp. NPDC087850 TaxID=3365809 RepID=UPI00380F3777